MLRCYPGSMEMQKAMPDQVEQLVEQELQRWEEDPKRAPGVVQRLRELGQTQTLQNLATLEVNGAAKEGDRSRFHEMVMGAVRTG